MKVPSIPTSPMFRTKSESEAPAEDLTSRSSNAVSLRTSGSSAIGLTDIDIIASVKSRFPAAISASSMR